MSKTLQIPFSEEQTPFLSSKNHNGYQVFWDGKDESGKYVSSGIYLVVMYAKTGKSSVEKIAVIRE